MQKIFHKNYPLICASLLLTASLNIGGMEQDEKIEIHRTIGPVVYTVNTGPMELPGTSLDGENHHTMITINERNPIFILYALTEIAKTKISKEKNDGTYSSKATIITIPESDLECFPKSLDLFSNLVILCMGKSKIKNLDDLPILAPKLRYLTFLDGKLDNNATNVTAPVNKGFLMLKDLEYITASNNERLEWIVDKLKKPTVFVSFINGEPILEL